MLFIDTASPAELDQLIPTNIFAGVTTNPTVLRRAGLTQRDVPAIYQHAQGLGVKIFFAQAVGGTFGQLRESAEEILELGLNVHLKLPATPLGLRVATELQGAGERILLTAVFDPTQGILAHELGLHWIAPYVGSMQDLGLNGVERTVQLHRILRTHESRTRVLAASLRRLDDLAALFAAGIPCATLAPALARHIVSNEHSVEMAQRFEVDAWAGTPDPDDPGVDGFATS